MTLPTITRQVGRPVFGRDAAGYHRSRPDYPEWVYQTLCSHCGLGPRAATFEIGPGTGIVTGRLLSLGAKPLIAVEPDPRLANFLRSNNPDSALNVIVSAFEGAVLEPSAFNLGVSGTAFHWLEEDAALAKIALLLRPGGWWAAFFWKGKTAIESRSDSGGVAICLGDDSVPWVSASCPSGRPCR